MAHQVEVTSLARNATCCDDGPDEHETPEGKNDHRCLCRFYALSLRLDQGTIQDLGAERRTEVEFRLEQHRVGIESS